MYLIGGVTAGGKSKLAVRLARAIGGEIVNADSSQLYKSIPILSAAPNGEELALVPHRLFGIYDDDRVSTVWAWARLVKEAVAAIVEKGKIPIIVGGTGMYLRAITHGLSPVPEISAEIGNAVRDLLRLDNETFYEEVIRRDPSIEGVLHPNDRQRLARALEVFLETGKSLRAFQGQGKPMFAGKHKYVVVNPDRSFLRETIRARVKKTLETGAIQEVEALKREGSTLDMPVCKAIGVKEIWAYLDGKITKEELEALMTRLTERYAKRQRTWFKNQASDAMVISDPLAPGVLETIVASFAK